MIMKDRINFSDEDYFRDAANSVNKHPIGTDTTKTLIRKKIEAYITLDPKYETRDILEKLKGSHWKYTKKDKENPIQAKPKAHRRIMVKYIRRMLEVATCLHGYEHLEFLNNGMYGVACIVKKEGKTYVAKFTLANDKLLHELAILKKFSEAGIGVRMIEYCFVSIQYMIHVVGIIIMEKVDTTMDRWCAEVALTAHQVNDYVLQLLHALEVMREKSMGHHDLHIGNIGINKGQGDAFKIMLIDFGRGSLSHFLDLNALSIIRSVAFEPIDEPMKSNVAMLQKCMIHHYAKFKLPYPIEQFIYKDSKRLNYTPINELFEQLSDKYSVSTERRREIEMVSNAT